MKVPALNFDREGGVDAIKQFIRDQHPESIIMIGCDSVRKEVQGKAQAVYATVIVVRQATDVNSYRGCKVFVADLIKLPDYGKVVKSGKMANLRSRMLQEVTFALEAFAAIEDVLVDRHWEIHIDINSDTNAESNVALADAKGYVMGVTGQMPVAKPDAPAASFAADMAAHGGLTH